MQIEIIAVFSSLIAFASAQAAATSSGFLAGIGSSITTADGTSTPTGVNIVISHATTQVGGDVTGGDGAANTNAVGSTSSSKALAAPTGVNAGGLAAAIGLAAGLML